jgi:propionyl-CoA carboxylase beta chain
MHGQLPKLLLWGAKGASEIILKNEINKAEDPVLNFRKETEYAKLFANPYTAAQRGFVDEVILTARHAELIKAYSMLENKVSVTLIENTNIPLYLI